MMMTIILLWVAGVCILIGLAVYRGRKKGVTQPSKEESSRSSADRVIQEIQSLQTQIGEMSKKLDPAKPVPRAPAPSARAFNPAAPAIPIAHSIFETLHGYSGVPTYLDESVILETLSNHHLVSVPYHPVFEQSSVLVPPEIKKVRPGKRPVNTPDGQVDV